MNIGIIGCGLIGQKRANNLAGARLIACADENCSCLDLSDALLKRVQY